MKNISDRHCRENQNTFSITFFFENRAVFQQSGKILAAGQTTKDNMAHAH
jgi:hypothetical protein